MRGHGRPLALIAILAAPSPLMLPRHARAAASASDRHLQAVARDHHRRGESLYVAERYAEALAEFRAGFAAMPLPGFLVNIGQCQRRLGDMVAARAAFERFLALAPDSPLAPEVRGLVRELMLTPPPLDASGGPVVVEPLRAPAPPIERQQAPSAPASASAPANPLVAGAALSLVADASVREADPLAMTVPAPSPRPRAAAHQRRSSSNMWLWGGVAMAAAALVSAALVIGASGGGTTTIHDGTLGTLRR